MVYGNLLWRSRGNIRILPKDYFLKYSLVKRIRFTIDPAINNAQHKYFQEIENWLKNIEGRYKFSFPNFAGDAVVKFSRKEDAVLFRLTFDFEKENQNG